MSNISAGDFACCGSWSRGCAIDKGCIYGIMAETNEQQTTMLLHAMKHCFVFHKIFIEKDAEYTKVWKESVKNIGRIPRQVRMATKETDEHTNSVIQEAEALLKSLGL